MAFHFNAQSRVRSENHGDSAHLLRTALAEQGSRESRGRNHGHQSPRRVACGERTIELFQQLHAHGGPVAGILLPGRRRGCDPGSIDFGLRLRGLFAGCGRICFRALTRRTFRVGLSLRGFSLGLGFLHLGLRLRDGLLGLSRIGLSLGDLFILLMLLGNYASVFRRLRSFARGFDHAAPVHFGGREILRLLEQLLRFCESVGGVLIRARGACDAEGILRLI